MARTDGTETLTWITPQRRLDRSDSGPPVQGFFIKGTRPLEITWPIYCTQMATNIHLHIFVEETDTILHDWGQS